MNDECDCIISSISSSSGMAAPPIDLELNKLAAEDC